MPPWCACRRCGGIEIGRRTGGRPRPSVARRDQEHGFDRPYSFVGFGAIIQLLERSARDLACPDFGFRLAERQDIGILGPLAVAMRYSATVEEAMRCASKYIYVYNAAIGFSVSGQGRRPCALHLRDPFRTRSALRPDDRARRGHLSRILSMLSAGRSHPRRSGRRIPQLPHGPPIVATWGRRWSSRPCMRRWRSIGRSRPASGRADQELRALAVDYLNIRSRHRRPPFPSMSDGDRTALGTGACGYAEVADAPSNDPRTLQRRLRKEGTTFEDMKTSQKGLAERYLAIQKRPSVRSPPARLQRAVGPQKLPALVPDDSQSPHGHPHVSARRPSRKVFIYENDNEAAIGKRYSVR